MSILNIFVSILFYHINQKEEYRRGILEIDFFMETLCIHERDQIFVVCCVILSQHKMLCHDFCKGGFSFSKIADISYSRKHFQCSGTMWTQVIQMNVAYPSSSSKILPSHFHILKWF